MNKLKIINAIVTTFLLLPIWLYLVYSLLSAINASDIQWFLFWIYVPLHLFVSFVSSILSKD